MMIPEEAAATLDGRRYGDELPDGFETQLKDAGLVAVFGYSDDNMELRGAIHDEVGAWNGVTVALDDKGLVKSKCEEGEACP